MSMTHVLVGAGPEAKAIGLVLVKRWGLASDDTPQPVSAMSPDDLSKIVALVPKNFLDKCDYEDLLKTKSFFRDTFAGSPHFSHALDLFKVDVLATRKKFSELVRASMKMCMLDTAARCRQQCGYASATRLRSHDDLIIDLKRGPNRGGVPDAAWLTWWTQVHGSHVATFSKQGGDNLLFLTNRSMAAMGIEYYAIEPSGRASGSRNLGSFKSAATKVYSNLLEWLVKFNTTHIKNAAVAAHKPNAHQPYSYLPQFPAEGFPSYLGDVKPDPLQLFPQQGFPPLLGDVKPDIPQPHAFVPEFPAVRFSPVLGEVRSDVKYADDDALPFYSAEDSQRCLGNNLMNDKSPNTAGIKLPSAKQSTTVTAAVSQNYMRQEAMKTPPKAAGVKLPSAKQSTTVTMKMPPKAAGVKLPSAKQSTTVTAAVSQNYMRQEPMKMPVQKTTLTFESSESDNDGEDRNDNEQRKFKKHVPVVIGVVAQSAPLVPPSTRPISKGGTAKKTVAEVVKKESICDANNKRAPGAAEKAKKAAKRAGDKSRRSVAKQAVVKQKNQSAPDALNKHDAAAIEHKRLEGAKKVLVEDHEEATIEQQLEAMRVCDHPEDHAIFQAGQYKSEANGAYSFVDGVPCQICLKEGTTETGLDPEKYIRPTKADPVWVCSTCEGSMHCNLCFLLQKKKYDLANPKGAKRSRKRKEP
jgi:deoxycytidylate deaminase